MPSIVCGSRTLRVRSPSAPYWWPLWLNLLLVVLASLVLLPTFLHDPNLTLVTLGLVVGLGLNFLGGVLALGLGRWRVATWFGVGMLFVLSVCWVAASLISPALLPQQ